VNAGDALAIGSIGATISSDRKYATAAEVYNAHPSNPRELPPGDGRERAVAGASKAKRRPRAAPFS